MIESWSLCHGSVYLSAVALAAVPWPMFPPPPGWLVDDDRLAQARREMVRDRARGDRAVPGMPGTTMRRGRAGEVGGLGVGNATGEREHELVIPA